jgi:ADP-ribose pyrophosphatase YjhB (NUDIX family)
MSQKYAVYLNRKALFFNNSQGIQPQEDNLMRVPGSTSDTLFEAIERLNSSSYECQQLLLEGLSLEDGLPLLKQHYRFLQAAGGMVETPNGSCLFIERLGCWDLPKGKVESGESLPIAAQREIEEETGITELKNIQELCRTWHTYEYKGKEILKETVWYLFSTSREWPTLPQAEEDITAAEWKSHAQWQEVLSNTYPSIVDVVECRMRLLNA